MIEGASREWLEADGLGGFASGTVAGIRTRRYHGILLVATTPPTGRVMLVNGFDAHVETPAGRFAITSQRYAPDVIAPDGQARLIGYVSEPWPLWRYRLDDGTIIEQELFSTHGLPGTVLRFRAVGSRTRLRLELRPFLSGRDYHALHHENDQFRFGADTDGEHVVWRPYPSVPAVRVLSNGRYRHAPDWYRRFCYEEERARGLEHVEDLASPGVFEWDLQALEAVCILSAAPFPAGAQAKRLASSLEAREMERRGNFPSPMHRAGDSYLVKRGAGSTIVAGYPWFTDWGRDTFIAMRGLCLATRRLDEARQILVQWTEAISEGMLPNRFPDGGEPPEYNSVDASLWFVIVVRELLDAAARVPSAMSPVSTTDKRRLQEACQAILEGHARGARHGIALDGDGLLAAGEPGVQLTWMDARVGDWVVTPRTGKAVEVQALWINALGVGAGWSERWKELRTLARTSFAQRFWNEEGGYLYDVVDTDHHAGTWDGSFRPNQIFAAGGLPEMLLDGERARRVVDGVAERLWTPMGLRTLAPGDPRYVGRYEGSVSARDGAYHQGTVWPWLMGPFAEAWVRTRPEFQRSVAEDNSIRRVARERFLAPLLQYAERTGFGHICEITDGDAPHSPRGCPFQAWSVGEALRLSLTILADKDYP